MPPIPRRPMPPAPVLRPIPGRVVQVPPPRPQPQPQPIPSPQERPRATWTPHTYVVACHGCPKGHKVDGFKYGHVYTHPAIEQDGRWAVWLPAPEQHWLFKTREAAQAFGEVLMNTFPLIVRLPDVEQMRAKMPAWAMAWGRACLKDGLFIDPKRFKETV
jgi:hypothetical protein